MPTDTDNGRDQHLRNPLEDREGRLMMSKAMTLLYARDTFVL